MTLAGAAPTVDTDAAEPPFATAVVEEALRQLVKTSRAYQLYLHNNPTYLRSLELLRATFDALWNETDTLTLAVTETTFVWEGAVVLREDGKSDSLPWLCYKDGVRDLTLVRGFEDEEVVRFLDVVRRVRLAGPDEDDLLTILWEQDFVNLRYRYVDLSADGAPVLDGGTLRESHVTRADVEAELQAAPRPGLVSIDDFESTLYFLDEEEIEYLRAQVQREYAGDLRGNVLAILFDIFERQADATVRGEICGILDTLMLQHLAAGHLRTVASLLREADVVAAKTPNLEPPLKQRLATLADRLSEPASLSQLLESLDAAATLPDADDLGELFQQLRPVALGTVFSWLSRTQNAKLRALLERAAERLAVANSGELVRLIGSSDRVAAAEAMRRAGGLRSAAAVAPLGRALGDADAAFRLVAAQALADIGSAGSMQLLEKAVEDADRDVRVAAVRAIGAKTHRAALVRIEAAIKGKALREADPTEKMAFFEAFGALCGDGGVPLLDNLLNGKGFLGRKEDTEIRACAAMALGRVRTPRASEALRKAADDKEVLVRTAVNRAGRASDA